MNTLSRALNWLLGVVVAFYVGIFCNFPWRLALKWLLGIVVALALGLAWLYHRDSAPAGSPMGEVVTADEDYLTTQIIAAAIDVSVQERNTLMAASRNSTDPPSSAKTAPGYSPDTYRRDAHAKGHGCVAARFTVNRVADRFAYGLFAQSGSYDAVIRFSNGSPEVQPDSAADARGMAIKVLGVCGKKLLPFEENGTAQDFILMNNPNFFIRTIEEYAQFNSMLANGNALDYFYSPRTSPLKWHIRELMLGKGTQKPRPDSLVTTRFWSGSAYALGPSGYVKYSAVPCSSNKPMPPDPKIASEFGYDFLRLELANQAAKGGACFDFMVQPQAPGKNMPIEDTTVKWSEADSPFVPVARIVLKAAPDNTAQQNIQCEAMAFNPWRTLADHRPVGVMNRVRKALYQAMAQFRQAKNCAQACEQHCQPKDAGAGCYDKCMSSCPPAAEPVSAATPPDSCRLNGNGAGEGGGSK